MILARRYVIISRYCFLSFLASMAMTFLLANLLPWFSEVTTRSQQCYWTDAMIVFIECGSDVVMGKSIAFLLNGFYALTIMPVFPFSILLFPPLIWPFLIFYFFFLLSYPILILRRWMGAELREKTVERMYALGVKIFIVLFLIGIVLQGTGLLHSFLRFLWRGI